MARSLLAAAALLLAFPLVGHAHFFRHRYTAAYAPPVVVAAYPVAVPVYPVAPPVVLDHAPPVYAVPPAALCVPVVPAVPAPVAVPQYAPPSAAPPSGSPATPGAAPTIPGTPMPPMDSPSSTLMTSAAKTSEPAFCDVYPVAPRAGAPATGERRPVSFWNLSGHAVMLKVAGNTQTVVPGERSRMELERQFVWQVDGREARREEIAAGAAGLEIVIRR